MDSGSRCTPARPWTGLEKPVWPGPRFRSLPRRTSPSQPPGSRGRWSRVPRRADAAGKSGLKARARSIKPIVIEASLRKAASGSRIAAVVHRTLPGSVSSPFSQSEAAASFSPSRPIQIPRTTKIASLARPVRSTPADRLEQLLGGLDALRFAQPVALEFDPHETVVARLGDDLHDPRVIESGLVAFVVEVI